MRRSSARRWCAGLAALAAGAWFGAAGRTAAQDEPGAALRAVYETRIEGAVQRWSFTRRGDTLEYHFFGPAITERWRRDARANVSYVRVFHREQTAVRYTRGDLLAFGVEPDWLRLSHVVAPPAADGFTGGKSARVLGREARRYQRAFATKRVEVAWLSELGIPAEVRIAAPGKPRVHVRLVELATELPPPLELRTFRQIDVADFGDMERDRFVVRHHDDPLPAPMPTLAVQLAKPPPRAAGPLASREAARHPHAH